LLRRRASTLRADCSARDSPRLYALDHATRSSTMPAVIDTHERIEHEAYDLQEALSQAHVAHAGFWHTVGAYVKRHRVHRRHETPAACQGVLPPMEMPLERMARENPMLFLQVNTGF